MRDPKQNTIRRLRVIRGQLDGVIKRAEDDFDPLATLEGLKVVRHALKSAQSLLIEACLKIPKKAKRALEFLRN